VDICIYLEHAETVVISFTGVGFDKRLASEAMPITEEINTCGVPSVQSVMLPGQVSWHTELRKGVYWIYGVL